MKVFTTINVNLIFFRILQMEFQSTEKHQSHTYSDYNGEWDSNVKEESCAQQNDSKCFLSFKEMKDTEKLLKEKEQEVEKWERKFNEVNEELTTLKEKMFSKEENRYEVSKFTKQNHLGWTVRGDCLRSR